MPAPHLPQTAVEGVAHPLLARVMAVVEEGRVRGHRTDAADPRDLWPAGVAALLTRAPLGPQLIVLGAQQGGGVLVPAVLG